jgi:hypothetical protein
MHHHLVTDSGELTGFVLEDPGILEPVISSSDFAKAENCSWDGSALTILLTQSASPLDNDGAAVAGPTVYFDGTIGRYCCPGRHA